MDQTEENKKEIESLKIRLKKVENFLLSFPSAGNYIQGASNLDPLIDQAIVIIKTHNEVSASLLQRRLSIGYSRAARMLDQLEEQGYLAPEEGAQPRKVIKK
jgi:S-DNA-T family DNA segregation ATPase FtsK/SpoIIIE